ncbi:MAG: polymer-forming cytoskeletal protein [Deltaproteobacteria bacterium]|nr:polymer-forming cytoskeletal protein [Deltaproteobacteria bacterium]
MWRWKGNNANPNTTSTSVVDQGCDLEGRITFVGTLVLNGKFQGEIRSSGTLLIGETAQVQADVQVGVLIGSGEVRGSIIASERVELKGTARIFGDIVTPVLVLEEGVIFDGHCKMKGDELRVAQKSS